MGIQNKEEKKSLARVVETGVFLGPVDNGLGWAGFLCVCVCVCTCGPFTDAVGISPFGLGEVLNLWVLPR